MVARKRASHTKAAEYIVVASFPPEGVHGIALERCSVRKLPGRH